VSEETPQEPVTPETPASPEPPAAEAPPAPEAPVADAAATAPTEETTVPSAAVDTPPVAAPAAAPAAPVAAAPVTAAKERKTIAVPMSVLITLGAIIVAALMFGIGYAVGHGDNDNSTAVSTPIGNNGNGNRTFPQLPGGNQQTPNQNGNGNSGNSGNSGGNQQTSTPPFMGVATQQTQGGLQVVEVVANSAAAKAGLQTGDVITEFDGDTVTTPAQLGNAVAQHDVGDQVKVTFTRDGQSKTVTVTLGARTTNN